ncbi:MAG: hypothetical protein KAS30_01285 [Candidatus Diapherotrites archaeon]|nr:hypothetical protein [Candidatus Diapherotrites archaeon]
MKVEIKEGFMVFDSEKEGPVYVAAHSATSLKKHIRGDVGTEAIAYNLCLSGGKAIISNFPRYNRWHFNHYRLNEYSGSKTKELQGIYDGFWNEVEKIGLQQQNPKYIFVHNLVTKLSMLPTIIDVGSIDGEGINPKKAEKITTEVNSEFSDQIETHRQGFCDYAIYCAKFFYNHLEENTIQRDINNLKNKGFEKEANQIENYLESKDLNHYLEVVEKVFNSSPLKITFEHKFNGKTVKHLVTELIEKTGGEAAQFEYSSYLTEVKPEIPIEATKSFVSKM